ncbi:UbiD family decarboxylase domain-containing protein, partial [Chloroflexota bacterium]
FARTAHTRLLMQKYEAMGKTSMPIAIAFGCVPVVPFVTGAHISRKVSEYEIIGAIQQEPLEIIKCEISDLEVPATAEIVLEGELLLDPATFLPEGPFGEYPGTYVSLTPKPKNVFQVNCVTHREDPILHLHMEGIGAILPKAKPWPWLEMIPLWHALENNEVPGITGIYPGDSLGWPHSVFVSINNMYYGHSRQIATTIWSTPGIHHLGKIIVVVDSDVDITNSNAVLTAIGTRIRPSEDIVIFPGTAGGALDPSTSPEILKIIRGGRWDRVLIDATWPIEWEPREEWGGERHPPYCNATKEMLEKVRRRWSEYGLSV